MKSYGGWKPALSPSVDDAVVVDNPLAPGSKQPGDLKSGSKTSQADLFNRASSTYGDWKDVAASEMKKIYGKLKSSGALVYDPGEKTPVLARRIDWMAAVRTPFAGGDGKSEPNYAVSRNSNKRFDPLNGGKLGDELALLHSSMRTAMLDQWLGNGPCDRSYVRRGESKSCSKVVVIQESSSER